MIFSSLLFLAVFLSAVLILYYALPLKNRVHLRTYRNIVLCVSSLFFYAWGEPICVFIMLFSIVMNYFAGVIMGRCREKGKPGGAKAALIAAIVLNLLMLGVFKYTPLVVDTLKALIPAMRDVTTPVAKDMLYKALSGIIPQLKNVKIGVENMLPIGISFYTFQAMSYVIDVYRGDTGVQKNPMLFGTYVALFPQLIAGPIVRYKDIEDQMLGRQESVSQVSSGIKQFAVGLAKKVLLANQLSALWTIFRGASGTNGPLGSWFGLAVYCLQLYFDFSGYSDMAIGLGRMFGFEFLKNFDYPYIAQSVSEFYRRWHISLSTWFREYVYFPLGGNRKGPARQVFNMLIVWALTGLWHGANWNFVLWGLWLAVFIIIEKLFLGKVLNKLPRVLRHVYTLFTIGLSMLIFDFTDLANLPGYVASMFDFTHGIVSHEALTYILSYLPIFIVGVLAATPFFANIRKRLDKKPWVGYVDIALVLICLALSIASLVSSGYNPFIYFRF